MDTRILEDMLTADIESFVVFWLVFVFLLCVWCVINYIIRSLSLYKLGRVWGITAYGLAWIPGAYVWVLGSVADKYDNGEGKDNKFRLVLIILNAAILLLTAVFEAVYFSSVFRLVPLFSNGEPPISVVLSLFAKLMAIYIPLLIIGMCTTICQYICYYKIFQMCRPEKPLKCLLISMLVPFAFPFVLHSCAAEFERSVEKERAMAVAGMYQNYYPPEGNQPPYGY